MFKKSIDKKKKKLKRKRINDEINLSQSRKSFGDIHNNYYGSTYEKKKKTVPAQRTKQNNKITTSAEFQRKRTSRRNELYSKLFAAFILIFFLFYIGGYFVMLFNRETTASTVILNGSIDQPITLDGVIVRDETVYTSPKEGEVIYFASDNDKVSAGYLVAAIQNPDYVEEIKDELGSLEQKIFELQERRDDFSIAQNDAKRINSQLKLNIDNSMFYFSGDNLEEFYSLKDDIDKKVSVRNQLLLEEDRGSVKDYNEERQLILNNLYNNEQSIFSLESGLVSYYLDDYEQAYTLDNLYSLTKEHIKTSNKEKIVVTNKKVNKDDKVFKIVNSNTWYIASYIDSNLISEWEEENKKTIYIENDNKYIPIETIIDKIINNGKESYVVFRTNKNLIEFIDKRNIRFKISDGEDTGLKIPNSAITEQTLLKVPTNFITGDTEKYVKRKNSAGEIEEVLISVNSSENDYTWLIQKYSVIKYGDIIVNPEDSSDTFEISDSVNIFGVYKINSGIAKFTQIQLPNKEIPKDTDGFTIFEPDKNTYLRVHDIIVTEALNIEEGQRIYKKN